MSDTKEKVNQITVKIGRLEQLFVYLKNKQEGGKTNEPNLKISQRAPKGLSLPGQVPDRSTTLPGGATVIQL